MVCTTPLEAVGIIVCWPQFKIGAATTVALAGLEDSLIQKMVEYFGIPSLHQDSSGPTRDCKAAGQVLLTVGNS